MDSVHRQIDSVFLQHICSWLDRTQEKLHLPGNKYHTTACCETKIIFSIEVVEEKDTPKEGPNTEIKFVNVF